MKKCVWVILVLTMVLLAVTVSALAEEVPFLTRTYPQYEVKLKLLKDQDSRIPAYAGPSKSYVTEWGYKPYKQRKITAYFMENDWVFVDFDYQTVEERFVYVNKSRFESLPGGLPNISSLQSYSGKMLEDTMPAWGPSSDFNRVDDFIAKAGMRIKVFFQENGFVYAEYPCNKGTVRMWLPADKVDMEDATICVTDETSKYYKVSTFGKYPSINPKENNQQNGETEDSYPSDEGGVYQCPDHPSAELIYWPYSYYLDCNEHEHIRVSEKYGECSGCGRVVYYSEDNAIEGHAFNDYGVCVYCGHLAYED